MEKDTASRAALLRIAADVAIPVPQVQAVAKLFAEGNTVPFIAR